MSTTKRKTNNGKQGGWHACQFTLIILHYNFEWDWHLSKVNKTKQNIEMTRSDKKLT